MPSTHSASSNPGQPGRRRAPVCVLIAALLVPCASVQCVTVDAEPGDLASRPFGTAADGSRSRVYSLREAAITVRVTDFGATLLSVEAPAVNGPVEEVLWGESDVSGLERGLGDATLLSWDQRLWEVLDQGQAGDLSFLRLGLEDKPLSPFPSGGRTELTITLDGSGDLAMELRANEPGVPVLPTALRWNLGGADAGTVLDHVLEVMAERVLALGSDGVHRPVPVGGTTLDFRAARAVGSPRRNPHGEPWNGRPTLYLLEDMPRTAGSQQRPMRCALRLRHPGSGRTLELWTDYGCLLLSCDEASRPGLGPLPATLVIQPVPVPETAALQGAQDPLLEEQSRRIAWRLRPVP